MTKSKPLLTKEERELIKKARQEFEKSRDLPQPPKQLQDKMQDQVGTAPLTRSKKRD